MQTILHTKTFAAQVARAGLGEAEVSEIEDLIARDPEAGVLMPGTGGLRKLRHPGRGKGKSGGYRTIHYFGGDDIPIFLMALVDKGEQADLSQAAKNEFRKRLPRMAADYRENLERVRRSKQR